MDLNYLYPLFRLDALNGFVVLFILIFTLLIIIYSLKYIRGKDNLFLYYSYLILTAVSSLAAVLANNLLVLLVFWGFLGLTLFLLINMGDPQASQVAKKTFIIVGGSDSLMLLGTGIIYYLTGTFQMDKISLSLSSGNWQLATVAYLCLAIACFAKAGAMPFHSWIPDCAESAPVPVVAYLPASLDKLLGIYLLARISLDLFLMNQIMNLFLMIIGAFTIIAAVMMALIQHNLKRLLGYHAVSQVGYMVLGIGTGNPIGIAGGIFHMLNHAIYKSCLFLTAGNVEEKTNTSELDRLGGLAKFMPITYISCLIASLSISGVPPFNGFVSKWMVYQGLISNFAAGTNPSASMKFIISLCLVAAMFGSALTLASFMKLIHATFLGQKTNDKKLKIDEVGWTMWVPPLSLAIICILFGVFAFQIPLKYLILPSIANNFPFVTTNFLGIWSASSATWLIVVGLIFGLILFKLGRLKTLFRQDTSFVGGETEVLKKTKVSGVEFYNTIRDIEILARIYRLAEKKFFDIYDQGQRLVFSVTSFLRYLHNGILPTYIAWCLLGMMVIFFILFRV